MFWKEVKEENKVEKDGVAVVNWVTRNERKKRRKRSGNERKKTLFFFQNKILRVIEYINIRLMNNSCV